MPRGPASTQGLLRDHIYSAMTFNKAALAAAALTCSIVLFNTFTVSSICQDPVWKQEPRDLDVVELWSGPHGALVVAAHAMGLAAEAFDTCRIPGITNKPGPACEDLTCRSGFLNAVRLIMRLRPGALLHQAPECSSFGFPPVSITGRSKDNFAGNPDSKCAQEGNFKALIAAFLLHLALARGAYALMENPAGSMIFSFLRPHLDRLAGASTMAADYCNRCAYQGDDDNGPRYLKRYKWISFGTWARKAMLSCTCGNVRHQALMEETASGCRNGLPEHLQASAAYPAKLGVAIVQAWSATQPSLSVTAPNGDVQNPAPASARFRRAFLQINRPALETIKWPQQTESDAEDPWAASSDSASKTHSQKRKMDQSAAQGPRSCPRKVATPCRSGAQAPSLEEDPWAASESIGAQTLASQGAGQLGSSHSSATPELEEDPWATVDTEADPWL